MDSIKARWIAPRIGLVALVSILSPPAGPAPAAGDEAGPSVVLTSPGGGATLSSTTFMTADAARDGVAIAGVQFLLDGVPLGPEDTSLPYEMPWDTREVEDGTHLLAARARDVADGVGTSDPVSVTVANGAVPTVALARFEETSATLLPSAAWGWTTSQDLSLSLSGDRAVYASESGATASLTFTGTGVRWIGFPCESCGVAEVRIDGVRAATVDTYAPWRPDVSLVMYTSPRLSQGTHTLDVEATGTANASSNGPYIVVDAFEPTLDGPAGTWARYEEPAAAWEPDATWTRTTSDKVDVGLSGGWAVDTAAAGATVTFSFTGTGVRWIGFPCELCGIADVLIDGVRVASVDTYSPVRPSSSTVMYRSPPLSRQGHTLAIEVTGNANPSSAGAYIVVDAFEPTLDDSRSFPVSLDGPLGARVRYEETAAALAPQGAWTAALSEDLGATMSRDRGVYSGDGGATATLDFVGTGFRWLGMPCEICGRADVVIDGVRAATVDTYAPVRPAASKIVYESPRLPPGSHTVTIEVTGAAGAASAGPYVLIDALEPVFDDPAP